MNTQDSVVNITAPSYANVVQKTSTTTKGTTKKDEERDQTAMITENTLIASSEVQEENLPLKNQKRVKYLTPHIPLIFIQHHTTQTIYRNQQKECPIVVQLI